MTFEERVLAVLGKPENYPDQMRAWVSRFLTSNPALKLSDYQLPSVESKIKVGGTGPAFAGAWVNYNAVTNEPAAFYKDPWLRVHLSGLVKSGAAGSTIYSLFPGYRPQFRETFAVITNTGVGQVDIASDGSVIHVSGGTSFVQLSGISFRAYS